MEAAISRLVHRRFRHAGVYRKPRQGRFGDDDVPAFNNTPLGSPDVFHFPPRHVAQHGPRRRLQSCENERAARWRFAALDHSSGIGVSPVIAVSPVSRSLHFPNFNHYALVPLHSGFDSLAWASGWKRALGRREPFWRGPSQL
jgi:hypothetical protein